MKHQDRKSKVFYYFCGMNQQEIIANTVTYVKSVLADTEGGHDWWHIERVWKAAKGIAVEENVDAFIVELAALLHDIADSKFFDGDEEIGPYRAGEFLRTQNVSEEVILHVQEIIRNMSFKASLGSLSYHSKELEVVQDADRLDAIGAIGIARAFSFGGFKGREFYNPEIKPKLNMSKEEYKKSTAPTVNHFYEKLLLLKDKMNTTTGKRLAEGRHEFMKQYLDQFFAEWEGVR
jgi:uncharacterized protein